jgi:hypothetical protein
MNKNFNAENAEERRDKNLKYLMSCAPLRPLRLVPEMKNA